MGGEKLWMYRCPRIRHLIRECYDQQCYMCISTLHHHWSPFQYRSAQTTQKVIENDDPGAYGMQINALLRQVHHRVTLPNDEADHKMEARLNCPTYKELLQVGDKVLIHRP